MSNYSLSSYWPFIPIDQTESTTIYNVSIHDGYSVIRLLSQAIEIKFNNIMGGHNIHDAQLSCRFMSAHEVVYENS